MNHKNSFSIALVRILVGAIISACVSAQAAPVTFAIEGVLGYVGYFGHQPEQRGLSSAFSGRVVVDVDNAAFLVSQTYPDGSALFAASTALGCRAYLGSTCIAHESGLRPVITGWQFSTEFGTFSQLDPSLGWYAISGIGGSRQSSVAVPGGHEFWELADTGSTADYSADPYTATSYEEHQVQRSFDLRVDAVGNGSLFGEIGDFSKAPDTGAASSSYFMLWDILGATRECSGVSCSDPVYADGSRHLEGQITSVTVIPEPSGLALALGALVLFAHRVRARDKSIACGALASALPGAP